MLKDKLYRVNKCKYYAGLSLCGVVFAVLMILVVALA